MKKQNNKPVKSLIVYAYSVMILLFIIAGCNNMTDTDHADDLQSQISRSEMATLGNAQIRVDVCHVNGKGEYNKITIAQAALETHLAHGDGAVGDPIPRMPHYIFGDNCEPIFDGSAVVDVTSATGRVWMDRNLGASRAATSSTDPQAYGDLYQWGRAADGHQKRNSGTTSTLNRTDTPGHSRFILSNSGANWDWRSPQNDNLWQGVNGINNPCPSGYRLPTEAEWEAERQSWSSYNRNSAFASPLKLPVAGFRFSGNGSLFDVGSNGFYWSSTVSGTNARRLYFLSFDAFMFSGFRAFGGSVRCIKENTSD